MAWNSWNDLIWTSDDIGAEFFDWDNNCSKVDISDEGWITWDELPKILNNSISNIDNILDIDGFTKNIELVSNYNDFARFKKEINSYLNIYFENKLEWKHDDFILAFNQSNVSKYQLENVEEKAELKLLIKEKNKLYTNILLKALILWKLDNIITPEDKNDFKILIKSGIFSYLDDIYINWYSHTYLEKAKDKDRKNHDNKLVYWWIKDWELVWYKEFCNDDDLGINDREFDSINDENLRKYLSLFSTFIKQWITNYDLWVQAEVFETNTWKNRKSSFGIVTPIEDYNFPELLVEPEFILFLKNIDKEFNNSDFYNLSLEFFWDKYWMDNMTLDFVETFLEWWESTFSGFIWKAFPNDNELSKREWNSIILKNTDMLDIVENSRKWFKNLFWNDFIFDFEKLYNEILKEVTYHEFWHSLFSKWHPFSQFEEAKATFFYYLQIFKENSQNPYTKEDISRVVEFTIMDSIRNLERISQEKSYKYLVLTKLNLFYLFESKLVYFNDDKLIIDTDSEKFDYFLNQMKKNLIDIKTLYKLDTKELLEREKDILGELDKQIMPTINKMIEIIKKED